MREKGRPQEATPANQRATSQDDKQVAFVEKIFVAALALQAPILRAHNRNEEGESAQGESAYTLSAARI